MDLGNLIYIVAILAYFIYQATRGKKKNQSPADQDSLPSEPEEKPTTFEDLLREIRDAQKNKPAEPVPPRIDPAPAEYKNEAEPVVRPEWRPDPAPAVKRFPTKKWDGEEIENYQGEFEKTNSDLSQTSKGIPEIPSLKETAIETSYTTKSRYARLLKDPKSLKEAIVLKEVLDRKHF
ncbi:hypothetical protein LZF95_15805 [Algoriphagus sp. AGSA1]|uniref:hypothetical protein n=1 Tax=Algoriphagus sp. AGSA1 TaxID=2907213 RepID=UPI001F28E024|nr:hypothetical protein [Algoriphagus sp. AGSA1]MCE7056148.1 hypothetical protein [Algoriphagus sp. AGSA1]